MAELDLVWPAASHIERPFGWKTWRVRPAEFSGTIATTVDRLQPGVQVLGVAMNVIEAGAGGSCALLLALGGNSIITTFDSTVLGNTETVLGGATITASNQDLLDGTAAGNDPVGLPISIIGSITGTFTTRPTLEVHVLCGQTLLD